MLSTVGRGKLSEDLCCNYLKANSYIILARNFHCRYGEIDIIAQENGNKLVFIEVKSLSNENLYDISSLLTRIKLQRIITTINYWFMINPAFNHYEYRIDYIGISLDFDRKTIKKLKHIKNCGIF